MNKCLVCQRPDREKPTIFRGAQWCSDRHRKVVKREVPPAQNEVSTMDDALLAELIAEGVVA